MNCPFLRLVEVTKRYDDRAVVQGLSLDITKSEIVALVGPSGCGKTTTLRLVAGLESPDEGEIWIEGVRVASAGKNLMSPSARRIGFVFQDLALWPHLNIASSLEFVLASGGVPKRERAVRIDDVLRLVRIESLAKRYPHQLSGGEQQRAALARALVGQPRLLLLDEPMSSLDDDMKAELLLELASLQQTLGITTIYVTHGRSEASTLAHRVAFMSDGCILRTRTMKGEGTNQEGISGKCTLFKKD